MSYMTKDLLIYGKIICAFPYILGSPSSYVTLHPIPSEFPYIWGKFCFLFYQCSTTCPLRRLFCLVAGESVRWPISSTGCATCLTLTWPSTGTEPVPTMQANQVILLHCIRHKGGQGAHSKTSIYFWERPWGFVRLEKGVGCRGGQNEDCLYSISISTFDTTCPRHCLPYKKGRIVRSLHTTFDLWKSRGIVHNGFYIETIPRDRDWQRSTKIAVESKTYILVNNFKFGKSYLSVWSLNICLSVGNIPGAMRSIHRRERVLLRQK